MPLLYIFIFIFIVSGSYDLYTQLRFLSCRPKAAVPSDFITFLFIAFAHSEEFVNSVPVFLPDEVF